MADSEAWQWPAAKNPLAATEIPHKDVTCLSWNPAKRLLALGTTKGGFILYNAETHGSPRRGAAVHVHSRATRRIAWIDENLLIMTSDDKTAVVADSKGAPIKKQFPKSNSPFFVHREIMFLT